MNLVQFIKTNMEQLLEDCEVAAIKTAPQQKNKASIVFRDQAREMLEFVIHDVGTYQTTEKSTCKKLGNGKVSVSSVENENGKKQQVQGLSTHQMLQELRALSARVTCAWVDKQGGLGAKDTNELIRFNEAIDQFISTSISTFTIFKGQKSQLIETIFQASPDSIAIFKPNGEFLFFNRAMADLINAQSGDVIGRTPNEIGLKFAMELQNDIATTVSIGQPRRRELLHSLPSGQDLFFDCQLVPIFNEFNKVEAIVISARDITDRKQIEYQNWRNANYDCLTSLPNRRLFIDRLEQTLLEAKRKDSSFAVLFIDLDRFKQANDKFGHLAGDQLLVQVAERISNNVRAMDTVARLGGDEFTLILKEINKEGAKEAAKTLLINLEQAFKIETHQVHLSGSIGLTLCPDDGNDVYQLMSHADQAMYAAKERGGHQVQVYKSSMALREPEQKLLSSGLASGPIKN